MRANASAAKWVVPAVGIAGAWALYYMLTKQEPQPAPPPIVTTPLDALFTSVPMGSRLRIVLPVGAKGWGSRPFVDQGAQAKYGTQGLLTPVDDDRFPGEPVFQTSKPKSAGKDGASPCSYFTTLRGKYIVEGQPLPVDWQMDVSVAT
jgi:hypothetical protein